MSPFATWAFVALMFVAGFVTYTLGVASGIERTERAHRIARARALRAAEVSRYFSQN